MERTNTRATGHYPKALWYRAYPAKRRSCDWFIAETDGCDICFGFAMLGDMQNAEWGYISLNELKSIRVAGGFEVDNDIYWMPKPASEVEIIRRAHRWAEQGGECYV